MKECSGTFAQATTIEADSKRLLSSNHFVDRTKGRQIENYGICVFFWADNGRVRFHQICTQSSRIGASTNRAKTCLFAPPKADQQTNKCWFVFMVVALKTKWHSLCPHRHEKCAKRKAVCDHMRKCDHIQMALEIGETKNVHFLLRPNGTLCINASSWLLKAHDNLWFTVGF